MTVPTRIQRGQTTILAGFGIVQPSVLAFDNDASIVTQTESGGSNVPSRGHMRHRVRSTLTELEFRTNQAVNAGEEHVIEFELTEFDALEVSVQSVEVSAFITSSASINAVDLNQTYLMHMGHHRSAGNTFGDDDFVRYSFISNVLVDVDVFNSGGSGTLETRFQVIEDTTLTSVEQLTPSATTATTTIDATVASAIDSFTIITGGGMATSGTPTNNFREARWRNHVFNPTTLRWTRNTGANGTFRFTAYVIVTDDANVQRGLASYNAIQTQITATITIIDPLVTNSWIMGGDGHPVGASGITDDDTRYALSRCIVLGDDVTLQFNKAVSGFVLDVEFEVVEWGGGAGAPPLVTGTLEGVSPSTVSSLLGEPQISGILQGVSVSTLSSFAGDIVDIGTLGGVSPSTISRLVGGTLVTGTIQGVSPSTISSLDANLGTIVTGLLVGVSPSTESSLIGITIINGTLAGVSASTISSLVAIVIPTGLLAGVSPSTTSELSGSIQTLHVGTLAGVLPSTISSLQGKFVVTGILQGVSPSTISRLIGQLAGQISGQLTGVSPATLSQLQGRKRLPGLEDENLAVQISQVNLLNVALTRIGGKHIASLGEQTAEARLLLENWDTIRTSFLSEGHEFLGANRTEKLIELPGEPADPSWQRHFKQPLDLLEVISVNRRARTGILHVEYKLEMDRLQLENRILCNEPGDVYLTYVVDVTNMGLLHPKARTALALYMAEWIAQHFAKSTVEQDRLGQMAERELKKAKAAGSQAMSPLRRPESELNEIKKPRRGFGGGRFRP